MCSYIIIYLLFSNVDENRSTKLRETTKILTRTYKIDWSHHLIIVICNCIISLRLLDPVCYTILNSNLTWKYIFEIHENALSEKTTVLIIWELGSINMHDNYFFLIKDFLLKCIREQIV